MTTTVTLTRDVEAGVVAKAQASGMPVEEYVKGVVEQDALSSSDSINTELAQRQNAVLRMIEFGEKYRLNFGKPITRALLHQDHLY